MIWRERHEGVGSRDPGTVGGRDSTMGDLAGLNVYDESRTKAQVSLVFVG